MKKRSLSIAGHRTSIALEDEFWMALEEILKENDTLLCDFLMDIDEKRTTGLASAIRVYVLNYYRK